jgi:hypothetical protein
MKKRAFVGSVVVVAAVLATFFTGIIPGFGRGSSSDGTSPTPVQAETSSEDSPEGEAAATESDPPIPVPPEPAGPPPEVVQVVVENDRIGLQLADGRYKVTGVDEVIETALKATGNEDGIKVRILRKASAKVVTWSMLRSELENSGIASSAILIPKKLVD